MMCLMVQEIKFQVQVLKSYKYVQETSEEVLNFKAQHLLRFKKLLKPETRQLT